MEISAFTITGVKSFDYFFSLYFYFALTITPFLLALTLFIRKWFK